VAVIFGLGFATLLSLIFVSVPCSKAHSMNPNVVTLWASGYVSGYAPTSRLQLRPNTSGKLYHLVKEPTSILDCYVQRTKEYGRC
jgi:hypothetical protein